VFERVLKRERVCVFVCVREREDSMCLYERERVFESVR